MKKESEKEQKKKTHDHKKMERRVIKKPPLVKES